MTEILARYPDDGFRAGFYRKLRLQLGGLSRIAALFPTSGLVVDLGCGMGLLSHLLVDGGVSRLVLAVDHDEQRVATLRGSAEGLPIEAQVGDMTGFEIPSCRGVALVDVLHYLQEREQEALIARAARALEANGVLVLRDPDADAGLRYGAARLHEKLAVGWGWTKARRGAYRGGAAWAALLQDCGLKTRVLPLGKASPYADRIVVGSKP